MVQRGTISSLRRKSIAFEDIQCIQPLSEGAGGGLYL